MIFSKKDWVKQKLIENDMDKKYVSSEEMYDLFLSETNSTWTRKSYNVEVGRCYKILIDEDVEICNDLMEEKIIQLEKQNQKKADLNNFLRKTNRENYRLYNTVEEIYEKYNELLSNIDLSKISIKEHKEKKNPKTAILQLSDLHANELINSSESLNNEYNFEILSKRMKKFIFESMKEFEHNNVENVYVLMTGDFINSSRRLSEKMAMNSSLTCASLLLTYILEQALIELSEKYNVFVSFVVGNESRIEQLDMDSQGMLATTNYDFLIFNNLRMMFKNKPIHFILPNNYIQSLIEIPIKDKIFNVIILHGHTLKKGSDSEIPQIIQQYLYNGKKVNGIFIGHYHHCQIGEILSMSGCMCGGNSYSSNDLKFISRASQNIYIINDDLSYKGIKIDLQNVDDYEGYDIKSELECYSNVIQNYNNVVTVTNLC